MKIKCEYIDKDSGCLVSFDGSCCKEECFTYRLMQKLKTKEQECEELKTMVAEAEEAPICFHCGEENCIKQERDKYKKLSIDFKDVNKQLGYKYLTLKEKLKQTEQENKRLFEIINAKPLETVDIDSAFEIEKLKEQLQAKGQECEELKKAFEDIAEARIEICNQCEGRDDYNIPCKQIRDLDYDLQLEIDENNKLKQTLAEINEIAEGMHDLWINKTKYTDIDNLVKHLLECELSRIIYKLDEISECEVEE